MQLKITCILRRSRPSSDRPGLRIAVWLQVKIRGRELGLWPVGCTPALSAKAPLHLQYAACVTCFLPLPAILQYRLLYLLPGLRLPSRPQSITAAWQVPYYTA